jgi:hypothetical protein
MNTFSKSLAALLLAMTCLSALAEVPDRVGRIANVAGEVQFYSEGGQGWTMADLNAPVSSRNSLSTGPDGRAELRFGNAAATLGANTQLDVQVLDDESFKARVARGSVSFRFATLESGESFDVTASTARYKFLQPGRYRVDAEEASSSLSVLTGLANAILPSNDVVVGAGKTLRVNGASYQFAEARPSALDELAAQRDDALRTSQATRYVSPQMTGFEDLDANGRWDSDPDYGAVWYPTTYVSSDWVPYRDGRWSYVAPWGWTWIDAAPWGFAPFHYGRWVRIGSFWAWTPGTYTKRPSYAPALVGFIGGTPGASISLGVRPALSWYPLPPWETYRPAYPHHSRHLSNLNNFRLREAPSSGWKHVDNQKISVNQYHGRTEVPHAAFVESRRLGRADLAPTMRGSAPHANEQTTLPLPSTGRGHGEVGEIRPQQAQRQEPAERGRRSPGPGESTTHWPPTKQFEPPVTSAPGSSPTQPARWRGDDSRREPNAVRPELPPTPPEALPGVVKRPEAWQRGSGSVPGVESHSEPAPRQNRFDAGRLNARPEMHNAAPPVVTPSPMRVEPPATRQEPRMDFQSRSPARTAEPPHESKREQDKERPGGSERGRAQGEGRGR